MAEHSRRQLEAWRESKRRALAVAEASLREEAARKERQNEFYRLRPQAGRTKLTDDEFYGPPGGPILGVDDSTPAQHMAHGRQLLRHTGAVGATPREQFSVFGSANPSTPFEMQQFRALGLDDQDPRSLATRIQKAERVKTDLKPRPSRKAERRSAASPRTRSAENETSAKPSRREHNDPQGDTNTTIEHARRK